MTRTRCQAFDTTCSAIEYCSQRGVKCWKMSHSFKYTKNEKLKDTFRTENLAPFVAHFVIKESATSRCPELQHAKCKCDGQPSCAPWSTIHSIPCYVQFPYPQTRSNAAHVNQLVVVSAVVAFHRGRQCECSGPRKLCKQRSISSFTCRNCCMPLYRKLVRQTHESGQSRCCESQPGVHQM